MIGSVIIDPREFSFLLHSSSEMFVMSENYARTVKGDHVSQLL